VVIVGIGGVGSWSAEAIARSGVGRITLIDLDHVSESNINRQIHALSETLGQAKVEAMRERILAINPACQINIIDDFVTPENWQTLVQTMRSHAPISALIDACDQVLAKTTIAVWALANSQIASVSVGAAGGKQRAHWVELDDLSQATHDPLLAKLRYNLRRQHGAAREGKLGVTCIYSKEAVQQPVANTKNNLGNDGSLNCHGYGSSVGVTATFGMCAASFVLESLAKPIKSRL
jgi:tRNA threonylcarbamoyladenosine dehydratase